jgi:hypothetical protein
MFGMAGLADDAEYFSLVDIETNIELSNPRRACLRNGQRATSLQSTLTCVLQSSPLPSKMAARKRYPSIDSIVNRLVGGGVQTSYRPNCHP